MKKLIILCILCVGCSKSNIPKTEFVNVYENDVPGTVTTTWEEPMIDTIEVPGQLDPNGITYRLPHATVVEIYPGRVQPVQFPEDK